MGVDQSGVGVRVNGMQRRHQGEGVKVEREIGF